jgi:RNA polymerase sigma-70 factor (TIGR02943 family)
MSDRDKSSEPSTPREWVSRYGDYLYNYAYMRLRDSTAAEDMVQETFLAALKAHGRRTGEATEITWLIAILKNKIVDYIRKVSRERTQEHIDELPVESEGLYEDSGQWRGHWIPRRGPVAWGGDPSRMVENKQFWEVFERCLAALPRQFARVFTLYVTEEMTTEKVCNILNVTATNLRVMLHRTRRQLRRCLELNWIGSGRTGKGRKP